MIYKITFNMTSPISFIDKPIFDSMVMYCEYQKQRLVTDFHTPTGKEIINFDIPIDKHEDGYYLASYMFLDNNCEGQDTWKKRWENKYDYIVNFGNTKKRIHTGSGKFKSYNIPINIVSTKNVWFYFSGDATKVKKMVDKYLIGIGKKIKIGFGWFSGFTIEKEYDDSFVYYRPLPGFYSETDLKRIFKHIPHYEKTFGAWKVPYWLPQNQEKIIKALYDCN